MLGALQRLLSQRVPLIFVLPVVLVSVYYIYTQQSASLSQENWHPHALDGDEPVQKESPQYHVVETHEDVRCKTFPDPGNLLVVVKTGATEAYEKLLPQLMTSLTCPKRLEIFSDLEETIGTHHLHDALKDIDEEMKLNHPDFEIYRLQQEYQSTGQDISELAKKHKVVWNLDKYKFMHMVQNTWAMHPDLEWYLFIESDTYVFWGNLNLWLQRLDPADSLYLGSEAQAATHWFAHGGSGFVISGALLKKFAGDDAQMASRNDKILENACCGDIVLGRALKKYVGVEVQNQWPWFNGETPWSIPYGPDRWCQPVITFHHLQPRQRTMIWNFEQKRKNPAEPLLFEEISELAFPAGGLKDEREDWDNLADNLIENPGGSPHTLESCKRACSYREDCWQYLWSDGECRISTNGFRMGAKKPSTGGRRWMSGWKTQKIEAFRRENTCKEPYWREDGYPIRNSIF
ncbi:hypothetical protein BKA67DRAFT_657877 [Truncatella angustata]|uniref:N-acetylgalactosaminide beta-1,3-galactosyltransferase n=1 Tax=Truncatella angustata TaxID=152316 RepID=A0A9P8UPI7_9PEZI|nr:uncharacterized protein BKA67DRAFT_657877 [Truncatella angustata]KAH6655983.1 hypothetical protein BKA67DRAFT_657877 [Truncatella angustata]